MGKCQQCDSHVKGCLRDARRVKKKDGQGRIRLTRTDSALGHVLSGFLVDRRMWSSAEPPSVVQSIQALDGQDASELRYAAAVPISGCAGRFNRRVRRDQPPGGATGGLSPRSDRRHPAAAPQRAVPVRGGENLRRLPPNRLERRAAGVAAKATLRHAGITGGAAVRQVHIMALDRTKGLSPRGRGNLDAGVSSRHSRTPLASYWR